MTPNVPPYAEDDIQIAMDALIARGPWRPEFLAKDVLDAVTPAIAARALRAYASDLEGNISADSWDRKYEFVSDVRTYADDVERGLL